MSTGFVKKLSCFWMLSGLWFPPPELTPAASASLPASPSLRLCLAFLLVSVASRVGPLRFSSLRAYDLGPLAFGSGTHLRHFVMVQYRTLCSISTAGGIKGIDSRGCLAVLHGKVFRRRVYSGIPRAQGFTRVLRSSQSSCAVGVNVA